MSYANIVIQPLSSNSQQPITTKADINGAFEIKNVSSFPILVTATSTSGEAVQYGYIKSASQTTVAANPITTLLITLANNGNPETIIAPIADASINQAQRDVNRILSQHLNEVGEANTSDFTSKIFSPNHTGIDLLLDSLGFNVSANGTSVITNRLTGQQYEINKDNIQEIELSESSKSVLRNLPISACSNTLSSLTSAKFISDDDLFSPNFLTDGATKTEVRALIRALSLDDGLIVTTPIFNGIDGNNNLMFDMNILKATEKKYAGKLSIAMQIDNASNKCVLIGNQYPFAMGIRPALMSMYRVDGLTNNVVTKLYGVQIGIGTDYNAPTATNYINGQLVRSARVEVCDKNNSCQLLAKMINNRTRGPFDIQDNSNSHHIVSNPNFSLFNNSENPIRISLFNSETAPSTGSIGLLKTINTRSPGNVFTSSEVEKITMPEITNAPQISEITSTSNVTTSLTLNYKSGSGVATGITALSSGDGSYVSNVSPVIMKKGAGTTAMSFTNPNNVAYRNLYISSPIPNRPGAVYTKYVWSPTCSGCY